MSHFDYGTDYLFARPTKKPRRKRYYVAGINPEGKHDLATVLAYDVSFPREAASQQGWNVLYVGLTPPPPEDGGFVLDGAALKEAIDFLGLQWKVEVEVQVKPNGSKADYRCTPTGGGAHVRSGYWRNIDSATHIVHKIRLKSYLTAEQASHAAWHELVHAQQAERIAAAKPTLTPAGIFREFSKQYRDGTKYENKRQEREANRVADDWCQVVQIAVPKKPASA